MTGWVLIIFLILLGGVLSTLGDILGSRIGKARLSIFKLRPRRTAVLITIFTGSLISVLSLSIMLFVSRELRVGLFELDDLQAKLKESREALLPLEKQRETLELKIKKAETELVKLSKGLFAFRKGEVVISSGQILAMSTLQLQDGSNIKEEIENIIMQANFNAFLRVRPGQTPDRRMVRVRRDHISRLETIISDKRDWVITIRSAGNVLLGESFVYAFPEAVLNENIVQKGEVISSLIINSRISQSSFKQQIKNLLASTLAEVKRRGSLVSEIQFDSNSMQLLFEKLKYNGERSIKINAISQYKSDTSDKISVTFDLLKKTEKLN